MPTYARGHVRAKNKDHLIQVKQGQQGARLKALHAAITAQLGDYPASYDSRTLGIIGPVKDQGQCGSCWDFSGTFVVETAFNKAGVGGGPGTLVLSEEYTLSCGNNGGCNGDDNVSVLDWAKKTGLPLSSVYGSYQASAGQCKYVPGMQLFKIDDWGFADANGGNGVTPVNAIKAAIMTFGCVGCAVAAGGSWDSWSSDPNYVHSGGSSNIDHDVALVGWDDAKSAWIMRNSWGTGWANGGYGWIAYGADDIGTESVWARVNNPNPPTVSWYF